MRTIKQILILALVALLAGNVVTAIYKGSSDRTIGPTITCDDTILEIQSGDSTAALRQGITAYDLQDGDLTDQIIIAGISKLISNNTAKVTYLVFDSDNNMYSFVRRIRYTDYHKPYFTVNPNMPLIYANTADISVLDRISAVDVVDGDISKRIRVSTHSPTADPEIFDITVQVTNSLGDTAWLKLPVQMLAADAMRPTVTLKEQLLYLELNANFDPLDYLVAATAADGTQADLAEVEIDSDVDTSKAGTYRVTYSYKSNGSIGRGILTVVVV